MTKCSETVALMNVIGVLSHCTLRRFESPLLYSLGTSQKILGHVNILLQVAKSCFFYYTFKVTVFWKLCLGTAEESLTV